MKTLVLLEIDDKEALSPKTLYSLKMLRKNGHLVLALVKKKPQALGEFREASFDGFIVKGASYQVFLGSFKEGFLNLESSLEALKIHFNTSSSPLIFSKGFLPADLFYEDLLERGLIPKAELWDALDEEEEKQGFFLVRNIPIPRGYYHLVVEILVRHREGDYLLMRRSLSKNKVPGRWEASASGSVLSGEASLEAAKRELREETGIDRGDFSYLGRHVYGELGVIFHNYLCLTDFKKDKITLQEGETMDYRWITAEEFKDFITSDQAISWQKKRYQDLLDRS